MHEANFAFWCLMAIAVLIHLNRWLAPQNVLAVAIVLGGWGFALAMLPFENAGNANAVAPTNGDIPPFLSRWDFPPFWIATVLSSRAAARLVLQNWCRRSSTGLSTLVLATMLISLSGISAQDLTTSKPQEVRPGGVTAVGHVTGFAESNFPFWMAAGLISLLTITPWLINKRSTKESRGLPSLALWLVACVYLMVGLVRQGAWPNGALLLTAIIVIIVTGAGVLRHHPCELTSPRAG
jgi:hypothetical protein